MNPSTTTTNNNQQVDNDDDDDDEESTFIQTITDIISQEEQEYYQQHKQGLTWKQYFSGGLILGTGTFLAWRGFHWGIRRALDEAVVNEEIKLDVKTIERAKSLAWKAFARGSILAAIGASSIGIGIAILLPKLPRKDVVN
jgi:hypothetical protein